MLKQVIITKGKNQGLIGYYHGSEVVDGVEMAILEMDWAYKVSFPMDSIKFLETLDSDK